MCCEVFNSSTLPVTEIGSRSFRVAYNCHTQLQINPLRRVSFFRHLYRIFDSNCPIFGSSCAEIPANIRKKRIIFHINNLVINVVKPLFLGIEKSLTTNFVCSLLHPDMRLRMTRISSSLKQSRKKCAPITSGTKESGTSKSSILLQIKQTL